MYFILSVILSTVVLNIYGSVALFIQIIIVFSYIVLQIDEY